MANSLTLQHLLTVVPYFAEYRSITEASVDLDIPFGQLQEILDELGRLERPSLVGNMAFSVQFRNRWSVRVIPNLLRFGKPQRLTPAETATFLLVLEAMEANDVAAGSAAKKLRTTPGPVQSSIIFDTTPARINSPTKTEFEATIRRAVREHRVVEIGYRKASGETSTRTLEPVSILTVEDMPYLRAVERAEAGVEKPIKSFRFDRITSAELLDDTAPRRSDSIDPLDPHGFGAEEQWALVEVDADATWISDYDPVFWDEPPESDCEAFRAYIPMGDVEATISFILRRFPSVRVLEPVSLAEAVTRHAKSALFHYEQLAE